MKKDPNAKTIDTRSYHPRRLARKVAKAHMEQEGIRKVNKHMAAEWKNYV